MVSSYFLIGFGLSFSIILIVLIHNVIVYNFFLKKRLDELSEAIEHLKSWFSNLSVNQRYDKKYEGCYESFSNESQLLTKTIKRLESIDGFIYQYKTFNIFKQSYVRIIDSMIKYDVPYGKLKKRENKIDEFLS